ncbi:MAG: DUF3088 domain-containing protein [Pseudomonadota bacterium]
MDRLFLLPAGFEDPALDSGGKGWVCPACAMVEGFLGDFPQVRDALDVTYLDYPRPRQAIVDLIGEDHQGLPLLILAEPAEGDGVLTARGVAFISDEKAILRWLAARHGVAAPHP